MSLFEWITVVTIAIVSVVCGYAVWNHFQFQNREYRKMKKDMKSGWLK
jgi:hypothetical protein